MSAARFSNWRLVQRLHLGVRRGDRCAERRQDLPLCNVGAQLLQEAGLGKAVGAQDVIEHRLAELAVGTLEGGHRLRGGHHRFIGGDDVQVLQLLPQRRLGDHPLQRLLPDLTPQCRRRFLASGKVAGPLRQGALVFRLEGRDFDGLAADLGDPPWRTHQAEEVTADPPADEGDRHEDEEASGDPGIGVTAELRDHETRRARKWGTGRSIYGARLDMASGGAN